MQKTATPATPEQTATPEQLLPQQLLQRVWNSHCVAAGHSISPVSRCFIIDETLPTEVIEQARELGLTPAQVCALIECWRTTMAKAVDEVAAYYIGMAGPSAATSRPGWQSG